MAEELSRSNFDKMRIMTCKKHEFDKNIYCVKCEHHLCPECMVDGHLDHERVSIQKKYMEVKN